MTAWRLIADIGGTNVRFARCCNGGAPVDFRQYHVAAFGSFAEALDAYLTDLGACRAGPAWADAAIAAAGPVDGDRIALTNAPWTVSGPVVSMRLSGAPVGLYNDLQAAALCLPYLHGDDLDSLLGAPAGAVAGATHLAVNIGTGFGAALLAGVDGGWLALPSEAGHMSLAADTAEECAVFCEGGPAFKSVEDVLSGAGIARLDRRLRAARAGTEAEREVETASAEAVFARADEDAISRRAVEMITRLIGRVTGDLVLAGAAWGGVYLFGSVVRGWREVAPMPLFQDAFVDKGRMSARMTRVPCAVVTNDTAPLIGLAHAPATTLPSPQ